MFAALSQRALQRAVDLADWTEANNQHRPFWNHAEYQRRFADTTDTELRVAARIIEARNADKEREIAALELLKATMRAARMGIFA